MSNYTHEECRRMIAGALYDFAAHLTALEHGFMVGAEHESVRVIDALQEWAEKRGNTRAWLDHADVRDWNFILLRDEHIDAQIDRLSRAILRYCPERITEGRSACDIATDIINKYFA